MDLLSTFIGSELGYTSLAFVLIADEYRATVVFSNASLELGGSLLSRRSAVRGAVRGSIGVGHGGQGGVQEATAGTSADGAPERVLEAHGAHRPSGARAAA